MALLIGVVTLLVHLGAFAGEVGSDLFTTKRMWAATTIDVLSAAFKAHGWICFCNDGHLHGSTKCCILSSGNRALRPCSGDLLSQALEGARKIGSSSMGSCRELVRGAA